MRRELLVLANGALVIDNPGMREFGVVGAERSFEDYVTYSGVDFGAGVASGRARMGISDGASSEEISSKYRSFGRFELEKKRITGQ